VVAERDDTVGPAIAFYTELPRRLRHGDSEHRFPTHSPRKPTRGEERSRSAGPLVSTGQPYRPLRNV